MLGAIQKMNARAEQTQVGVERTQNRLAAEIRALAAAVAELEPGPARQRPILVGLDGFSRENPEIALLQYLYSFLHDTTAVDVGAHVGEVSERLLQAGYSVHAFEPYPPSFEALRARFADKGRLRALQLAIGSADGEALLHVAQENSGAETLSLFNSLIEHPMPGGLQFTDTIPVRVRSLASLRGSGQIPASVGLLKIDTEGFDLEVINGMGEGSFEVVMAEFWDSSHAFGTAGHGRLEPIIDAMRAKGYAWHAVIYHLDSEATISYYFNRAETIPGCWGNAIFFREHALFAKAACWCEAALTPTLYR
jgi:FkbM family methyltransferase